MKQNEKVVMHVGAHIASQAIAASLTKNRNDSMKTAGVVIAIVVGVLINILIRSL